MTQLRIGKGLAVRVGPIDAMAKPLKQKLFAGRWKFILASNWTPPPDRRMRPDPLSLGRAEMTAIP